ncbi:hypothetical protein MKW98_025165 [Papaver atlanticum]|uniref:Non-specific lipid-transfer protein n=1 Tax=Papaver atlanticum TaxID=357466 RepID=A0AAD4S1E0_9MAGN|nr:hypothetical protein MKW98_025165 [Papaver atlanticum]
MAAVFKLACLVLAFMVVAAPYGAEGTLTYGQVAGKVGSCLGYLRGGVLDPDCCPGVVDLLAMAKTKDDRQAVCRCLKYAVQTVTGIKMANVVALPGKCDVTIPYKIGPATDCATYVLFSVVSFCSYICFNPQYLLILF